MTCIVGLEHNGKVYMAGDSSSVSNYDGLPTQLRKVFTIGNRFLIGYTSSFRMGQLLQYKLKIKKQTEDNDLEYMATTFVDAVRDMLKENGYARIDSNEETAGTFLVGYNGSLYKIDSDYQVNKLQIPYNACGSGESYALAAMYNNEHLPPKKRLLNALDTSAYFNIAVYKPFFVEVL